MVRAGHTSSRPPRPTASTSTTLRHQLLHLLKLLLDGHRLLLLLLHLLLLDLQLLLELGDLSGLLCGNLLSRLSLRLRLLLRLLRLCGLLLRADQLRVRRARRAPWATGPRLAARVVAAAVVAIEIVLRIERRWGRVARARAAIPSVTAVAAVAPLAGGMRGTRARGRPEAWHWRRGRDVTVTSCLTGRTTSRLAP